MVVRTIREMSATAYVGRQTSFNGWPANAGPLPVDREELAAHGFAYNGEK
jgi:hypothetical protein